VPVLKTVLLSRLVSLSVIFSTVTKPAVVTVLLVVCSVGFVVENVVCVRNIRNCVHCNREVEKTT
jgi:hypothetical protein